MKFQTAVFAVMFAASTLAGGLAQAQPRHLPPPPPKRVLPPPPPLPASGEVRQERWDLQRLQVIQDRFAQSRARRDYRLMRQVESELAQYVQGELREARIDVREAKAKRRGKGRYARNEVREESKERKRIRAIDKELTRLAGRFDRRSVATKGALISELIQLARADVGEARMDARSPRRR